MQVSAVNSTNFGKKTYSDICDADIKRAEEITEFIRARENALVDDRFDSENQEPKKKSVLATAASIAVGLVGMFCLAKKGYQSGVKLLNEISKTKTAEYLKKAAKAVSK